MRRQVFYCLVEISKFPPEPSFGEPPRNRLIACAILRHRHPRLVFPLAKSLSRIVYARGPIGVASRFVCPVAYQPLSRAALNKLRQLGDVRCYPPRLVAREQLGCYVHFTPESRHRWARWSCPLRANSGHDAYQTFPLLEPLGASLTLRIGKIAIECKADILHQGVDPKQNDSPRYDQRDSRIVNCVIHGQPVQGGRPC